MEEYHKKMYTVKSTYSNSAHKIILIFVSILWFSGKEKVLSTG